MYVYKNFHNHIITLIREAVNKKRSLKKSKKYKNYQGKRVKLKLGNKGFVKAKKKENNDKIMYVTYH